MPMRGLVILVITLLVGCSTTNQSFNTVPLSSGLVYRIQPIPEQLKQKGQLVHMRIDAKEKSRELLVQSEIYTDSIIMTGMTIEGISLFSIEWNYLNSRYDFNKTLPIDVEPRRFLAEYQLSNWSESAINTGLINGSYAVVQDNSWVIKNGNKVAYRIERGSKGAAISNIEAGYKIYIKLIQQWSLE